MKLLTFALLVCLVPLNSAGKGQDKPGQANADQLDQKDTTDPSHQPGSSKPDENNQHRPAWINDGQVNRIVQEVNKEVQKTNNKFLENFVQDTEKMIASYKGDVETIIKEGKTEQIKIQTILETNMNKTETKMSETNDILKQVKHFLKKIKKQGEDKTYENTSEVASQLGDRLARVVDGAVYLFTEEVRYPQEALGLLSLNSTYNKKVAPKHKSVRGWMRPTFVTDIDSMKQRMGLEIFFVLMWQEDSRVNWALLKEMKEGVAFSFSPSVLE